MKFFLHLFFKNLMSRFNELLKVSITLTLFAFTIQEIGQKSNKGQSSLI